MLEHNIFVEREDFRKLFTTRDTFLNRDLAALYRAKVMDGGMFTKIMLPEDIPRRGLLGHGSFLAGTSAPDKTSPTARGKFVREVMLCEPVPPPPPNVDTNLPEPAEGEHQDPARAARGAPPGLRLRQVPPSRSTASAWPSSGSTSSANTGRRRTGVPIDPSGDLDGKAFASPVELGELLSRDPRVPDCLMRTCTATPPAASPSRPTSAPLQELRRAFKDSRLPRPRRGGGPGA